MAFNGSLDHLVPQMGRVLTNDKSKLNQLKFGYNSTYVRPAVNREPKVDDNSKFNFSTFTDSILIQGVDKADHASNMMYTFANFGDLTDENNAFLNKLKSLEADGTLYAVLIGDNVDVEAIPNELFANNTCLRYVYIGKKITEIGNKAFKDCKNLSTVTGFDNVATIGQEAFSGCASLVEIPIRSTYQALTTIGSSAFLGCASLTSITLNDNITTIPASAFSLCKSLSEVNGGISVETIGSSAFNGCGKLISLGNIGTSLTELAAGGYQFYGCESLSSVNLGETITTISNSAFKGCKSLTSIEIPTTVTAIKSSAFANTGITDIEIASNITELGTEAFANCENLNSFTFGSDSELTTLGDRVFSGDTSITHFNEIPSGITTISVGLFDGASLPQTYTLQDTITEINSKAFANTRNIETLYIGENIETIDSHAFDNTSIKTIVINKGPGQVDGFETKWGANEDTIIRWTGQLTTNAAKVSLFNTETLELTEYDTIADVNNALTEASEDARYELIFGDDWCSANSSTFTQSIQITTNNRAKISKITIGEGVTAIGNGLLSGFVNANELVLPSTLETIGNGSCQMAMIEDIVIPDSVTSIGNGAFAGSHGIRSITFGSGLTEIGQGAFSNSFPENGSIYDDTITTLNIPAATTKIRDGAFSFRYTIKTVNIGDENHASQLQLSGITSDEYYSTGAFVFIDPRVSRTGTSENLTINIYGKTAEDYTKETLFKTITTGDLDVPADIDAFFTEHHIQINFIPVS